jgi:hypothetical protein
VRRGLGRSQRATILDEVAEVRVPLLADRGLQRKRLLAGLDDLADLLGADPVPSELAQGRLIFGS